MRTDSGASRFFASPSNGAPGSIFRLDAREFAWVVIGSLVFAAVFLYPLLCDIDYLGPGLHDWLLAAPHLDHLTRLPINNDSDLFDQLRWVPYYTLMHFHQWPYWNPYKCGGMVMLGNPESAIVTPFFLIYLVGGLLPGLYLEIYLHIAIAFVGGYVLGRELGLRPIACVALAGMFPSSSWLPLHIAFGHLNFLPAVYFPWITAMLLASCRMRRAFPAAIGGVFCALTLTEGNYTLLYAVILIGIVATTLALTTFSVRPLIMSAIIGAFAFALCALKFVPSTEALRHHSNLFGASWLTWQGAIISLFSRNQDAYRPSPSVWYMVEYGGYLGAPFVALALTGIVAAPRRALPYVLGTVVFFLLFMGDTGPHALITYLRQVPFGGNIGICGRWVIPLVFCVGVLAALGAQFVCDHGGPWGPRIAVAILSVGLVDAWLVGSPNYRYLFHYDFERPKMSESFRQFWVDIPIFTTYISQANMGSLNCQGFGYNVPPNNMLFAYNQNGYRGEYFMSGDGTLEQTEWTPNRLSFDISPTAPTTLVINQNFDVDWRIESGHGAMTSDEGRLAVAVPAGHQRLTIFYRPQHMMVAVIMTAIGWIAFVFLWWWERPGAARDPVSLEPDDGRRASAERSN
jgi:hypothetical protein